jgi:hypothetical protein
VEQTWLILLSCGESSSKYNEVKESKAKYSRAPVSTDSVSEDSVVGKLNK